MCAKVARVQYFHATVEDRPGEAYRLLAELAESAVSLFAFSAVPVGQSRTQLVLFPQQPDRFVRVAERAGISLTGPQHALLVRGEDRLGALADIHQRLYDANINVYASNGLTADCGRFGYILHVRDQDFERAAGVLGA